MDASAGVDVSGGASGGASGAAHGAALAAQSSVWESMCSAMDLTAEQRASLLSLHDAVTESRNDFAESLSLLRSLEARMTASVERASSLSDAGARARCQKR